MELVIPSEAARRLSIHPSQITRGIQSGLIPVHGDPLRPLIDVDEAREARAKGLDRSKQRGTQAPLFVAARTLPSSEGRQALVADGVSAAVDGHAPEEAASALSTTEHASPRETAANASATDDDNNPSYQASRARRETAAARRAEIELAQLRGQTLDRGEVADVAFRLGQMLREGMETRRAALAQRLAGLDAGAMIAVLTEADDAHLVALADAIARDLAPETDRAAA